MIMNAVHPNNIRTTGRFGAAGHLGCWAAFLGALLCLVCAPVVSAQPDRDTDAGSVGAEVDPAQIAPHPGDQGGSIVGWGSQIVGADLSGGFVAVAAGNRYSMGLKPDGSIVAWGDNIGLQCRLPEPNTGFVAFAGGGSHSLGLKDNSSIAAWGSNWDGQTDVPEPNTGFVAVAAGWDYSLGLKDDGSIVGWGRNRFGQTDVPEPNTGFVDVARGWWHGLGLKDDSSIVAWGRNYFGGQTEVPEPNTGYIAVTGGGYHSVAIREHGLGGAEAPAVDWDRNGVIDTRDVAAFLADWTAGEADFNGDGVTDSRDAADFVREWAEMR